MNIFAFIQKFKTALPLMAALLCLTTLTAFSQTGEPSREPILRIETGMHTADIGGIGVDAAGKFLVTASTDKTARIWDIGTGELLRVLRPPIGAGIEGIEGVLCSVAISPDGTFVAVSGNTVWDKSFSIYLFDRASGRLVRRLSGLPSTVYHLVFSPDGKYFVATLGQGGVRVYETGGWQQIGADADYGNRSFSADFDRSGRLVTSCFDGFIRLYAVSQSGLRRLAKKKASGGKQPFAVKFSPDAGKIAVGFYESTNVNVLLADDLSLLFAPDTSGVNNGDLLSVAWSATGDILYAGGQYQTSGNRQIRFWTNDGRGSYQETDAALNMVMDIQTLPNGGVIYGTSDPAWGTIDASGKRTRFVVSGIADYRALLKNFKLSNDGAEFQFGYQKFGKELTQFSFSERRLITADGNNARLQSPRTDALNIYDWLSDDNVTFHEPKLNGSKLNLWDRYETSRSLAIAPDNSKFLLGTGGFIYLFDRTGKELWKLSAPGAAWSVNISGDGRLAIAAFGDGTIRWYRISDGKELLAFFPHADRKRWVLWTPSGYYDASPGAEDLIGWHVNNGKDQAADFFPVGQFRSTYYRPDVISKILETGDEARSLQLANEERGRKTQSTTVAQMLPPVVEIASPADNSVVSSSEVTIRYSLRTASGESVTKIRALIDGRPVTENRQLTREDASATGVRELKVSVPEQDSEVSIIAENRFAASVPATIRLKWKVTATPTTTSAAFVIQPKLYVLAIGVSQYQNPAYSLKFAAKDAQDFANAAMIQKGLLYRDVVTKVLTNEHANKDEILDGLDWIRKQTTSKDVAMVFFAGHGMNDQNGVYYFLPYNTDLEKILRTGVPYTDIKNTVQSLAGKTLFFIDTCHSGNVLGGRRGLADDLNGIINELSSAENGAIVFAASTGNQSSFENATWNNGAFTKALVEGLTGRADYNGKGKITVNMLDLYLSERVKELTGGKQTPTTAKPNTVPDFPIAIRQ